MKQAEYKVVTSTKGFEDLEAQVNKLLNTGWKPIGGIAFNLGYPFQAVARITEAPAEKPKADAKPRTANQAMKEVDSLT